MYCRDIKKYMIVLCSLSITSLVVVYHFDSQTCRSDSIEQSYTNAVKVLNSITYSKTQLRSTPKDSSLYIEDVLIALNSTKRFHSERVQLLLDTWITQAKQAVHLVTDRDDPEYARIFGKSSSRKFCGSKNKVPTISAPSVTLKAQYGKEKCVPYNQYSTCMSPNWDYHTYVNIPVLVRTLRQYNYQESWYLGRRPVYSLQQMQLDYKKDNLTFQYATENSGICISKALVKRMMYFCEKEEYLKRGAETNTSGDITIGYVVNYLLKVPVTIILEFHSNLEPMWEIDQQDIPKQITISWGELPIAHHFITPNTILLSRKTPQYPRTVDPTRVYTLHCYLFPNSQGCDRIKAKFGPLPAVTVKPAAPVRLV